MSRVLIGNIKGPKGDAATIGVGDVTTVAPGTGATVTNSGTSDAAILDFRIPKGDKGDPGDPGVNDYASSSAAGLVRVGDDVAVDSSSGILSLNSTNITEASSVSNINSGDSYRTILGKLKKFISTLMPSNFLINTVNSNAADKGLTANMGNKLAGDIATVQTSNTATRNFAVGEYIVYNGIMYKVTTAIASGGTLTPGTNLTATNAGAQLKSLNDSLNVKAVGFTPSSEQSNLNASTLVIRQFGDHVLSIYGFIRGINTTANQLVSLGYINGGIIPGDAVRFLCNVGANAFTTDETCYGVLNTSGELSVMSKSTGTNKAMYFNITYIR